MSYEDMDKRVKKSKFNSYLNLALVSPQTLSLSMMIFSIFFKNELIEDKKVLILGLDFLNEIRLNNIHTCSNY